jgi:tripartite-type tricarboxylate transporter receptor subunit TctC
MNNKKGGMIMKKQNMKTFRNALMKTTYVIFLCIVILGFPLVSSVLAADDFPNKPITIWGCYGAGGTCDTYARAISVTAEKILGQPIIVDTKPGGAGTVATTLLKNAKPDGYTLGACTDSPFTRVPFMMDLEYDPLKDFTFISLMGTDKTGIATRSDSPFKTYKEMIEWAKQHPGELTHGTPGKGNMTHLAMVKIEQLEGIKMRHIFFKGSAEVNTALLGGHVMVGTSVVLGFKQHVEAGTLRPLMIFYPEEGMKEWPDVPSLYQVHKLSLPVLEIIYGPKGIPKPIADKLTYAFNEGVKAAPFQKIVKQFEVEVKIMNRDELQEYMGQQHEFYGDVIKSAGLLKK